MASSSSLVPNSSKKYDVFLSFRGEDTRNGFISHLHKALLKKNIETYMDEKLERGDVISGALLNAIEESKISLIIFSENYASSSWCLDELVHILQCKEKNGQIVLPVFYHVDPSNVRKQQGDYAVAFSTLENHFKDDKEKLKQWRDALTTAANLSGWDGPTTRNESELVETIVNHIEKKLKSIPVHDDCKGLTQKKMATLIRILRPNKVYGPIRARICRLWSNNDFATEQLISLDCLLVDEEHEAIRGSIKARDADFISQKIHLGSVYDISNFFVAQNKPRYKIVQHSAMLQFARATSFVPVTKSLPPIPILKFNFIEFDQLHQRIDNTELLTDIVGVLISVQTMKQTNVNNRITARRTLMIQNIRSEQIQVILWEKKAEEFDENVLKSINEPVVIAFAAMVVKKYLGSPYISTTASSIYYIDPDIVETKTLKTRFSHQTSVIAFLPTSTKLVQSIEEEKLENKKIISELKALDPQNNQNTKFTVKATITGFFTTQGWYYNSCPRCNRQVKQSGSGWWCDHHGNINTTPTPWYKLNTQIEDNTGDMTIIIFGRAAQTLIKKPCSALTIDEGFTDPSTTPPVIDQLRGQTKIFQLYFQPRRALIVMIVSKIFEDIQSPLPLPSLSPIQQIDPKTPDPKTLVTSSKTATTTSLKRPATTR